jgi:hypothetical protein
MLNAREAIRVHVMLLQYYIEGEPCPASALTVSPDYIPNLQERGSNVTHFFSHKILSPQALAVGQRRHERRYSSETEVKVEDIVAIIVTPESAPESILYAMS